MKERNEMKNTTKHNDYHCNHRYISVAAFEEKYGIKFTQKHNGKMEGMMSLSTSPLENTFCKCRRHCPNSICSHCYSYNMNAMFKTLAAMLKKNLDVLSTVKIPVSEMPVLNALYFRFEAFGDLQNETQLENYFNLCERNPETHFAIWSKNLPIVKRVIDGGHKKPANLQILASSMYVDKRDDVTAYDFVDKVFTVYSKEYAKKNNVKINCGGKSCLGTCGNKCYKKNGTKFINELLK